MCLGTEYNLLTCTNPHLDFDERVQQVHLLLVVADWLLLQKSPDCHTIGTSPNPMTPMAID